MSRSAVDRLQDILQSTDLAARHADDLEASVLAEAAERRDATLFRLAVVCEAASRLPAEIQALAPDIPWARIRNTRNHVIHAYWQIDFVIVVDTIATDLPKLKAAVQRLITLIERNA